MNTGHEGSMSTIHANSPRDALYRLENMLLMANLNLPIRALRMQIASALNLVVQIERMRDGHRRVINIVEITGLEGDVITLRDIFTFQQRREDDSGRIDGTFEATGLRPNLAGRAARIGLEADLLETVGIGRG
jgi:pilus assembly protein CpaF